MTGKARDDHDFVDLPYAKFECVSGSFSGDRLRAGRMGRLRRRLLRPGESPAAWEPWGPLTA